MSFSMKSQVSKELSSTDGLQVIDSMWNVF